MPPRKSTEAAPGDEPAPTKVSSGGSSVEDFGLPRSMVARLAKGVLPPNTQIQKDALLAMQRSATVFVNYLASSANDRTVLLNKKTIQPKEVIDALDELEFEGFKGRCQAELERYSTKNTTKRNDYRRRVKEEREGNGLDSTLDTTNSVNGDANAQLEGAVSPRVLAGLINGSASKRDRSPPSAKRPRTSLNGEDTHTSRDEDEDMMVNEDGEEEEEDLGGDDEEDGEEEEEEEDEENLDEDEDEEEEDEDKTDLDGDESRTALDQNGEDEGSESE